MSCSKDLEEKDSIGFLSEEYLNDSLNFESDDQYNEEMLVDKLFLLADVYDGDELVERIEFFPQNSADFKLNCLEGHFTQLDSFSLVVDFGPIEIAFHREGGPCNGEPDVVHFFETFNDDTNLTIAHFKGLVSWDSFDGYLSIDTVSLEEKHFVSIYNDIENLGFESGDPYHPVNYRLKNVKYRLPIFQLD